jgi:hypothetical protein
VGELSSCLSVIDERQIAIKGPSTPALLFYFRSTGNTIQGRQVAVSKGERWLFVPFDGLRTGFETLPLLSTNGFRATNL